MFIENKHQSQGKVAWPKQNHYNLENLDFLLIVL